MTNSVPLSEAKRRLLQQLQRGTRPLDGVEVHSIGKRLPGSPAPLSSMQEELWRFETSTPGLPTLYNESIQICHRGALDERAVRRALAEIVRRHEIWRTSYDLVDGNPVQVVHAPYAEFPLGTRDLRALTTVEKNAELAHQAVELAREPYDLRKGPLVRGLLVRVTEDDHRLLMNAHQSIVDGVSVYQVLPAELKIIYAAFVEGSASPLPELPIQFTDYAAWQRESLQGEEMSRQLTYWREKLAGEAPVLRWPDHPRPAGPTYRGEFQVFDWPSDRAKALKALCHTEGSTLFLVLLAGFAALLSSYAMQDEVIIGTLSPSGRKRSEVVKLLGYFLNPVPLRFQLPAQLTFRQLLSHAREILSGALSNDDVPFDRLVQEVEAKVRDGRHPLFTVAVSLQPPQPDSDLEWRVTSMDADNGGSRWDLYLAFIETPGGLIGRAQYNLDILDATIIRGMIQDLGVLLDRAIADPQQRVSELMAGRSQNS